MTALTVIPVAPSDFEDLDASSSSFSPQWNNSPRKGQRKSLASRRSSCGGGTRRRSRRVTGTVERVLPSDNAYVDLELEDQQEWPISLFDVQSVRKSQSSAAGDQQNNFELLSIVYNHVLSYRGEPIFSITTTTKCNGTEIWGQSSTAILRSDGLKVRISNKAKSAAGEGSVRLNQRENLIYSLSDLVQLSAQARQSEMNSQSTE